MRKVFRYYSECATKWVEQSQTEGSARGQRMYFEHETIYSYRESFPIAKFYSDDIVLFTSHQFGNTTARHKREVYHALDIGHNNNVYYVDQFFNINDKAGVKNPAHVKNLEYYVQNYVYHARKFMRAREMWYITAAKDNAIRWKKMVWKYRETFEVADHLIPDMSKADKIFDEALEQEPIKKEKCEVRRITEKLAQ